MRCIVIIMTVYLIVYTLYSPNLLWEHNKIILCMWLTINLLVGVTSTRRGIVHYFGWLKVGMIQSKGSAYSNTGHQTFSSQRLGLCNPVSIWAVITTEQVTHWSCLQAHHVLYLKCIISCATKYVG